MSGSSETHHHKHLTSRDQDESTDTYREGFQKGQSGGDRGLVSEYDGGNAGREGLHSGHSHGQGAGHSHGQGTDYNTSGSKGYDSGPVSAPRDTDTYTSSGTGGGHGGGLGGGSTGGNKHYGLDDGYVTRDMSVLGINEQGGGHNVGMSHGGGALNEYGSGSGTGHHQHGGHQHDSGVHFGGASELGPGRGGVEEYGSRQSELGPAGVGTHSTRGQEYASAGMGGQGYGGGSTSDYEGGGSAGGLNTGGVIEADQVDAVHQASKPPSKVKQVLDKVVHHKARGPYDSGPQTGPAAFTPMSTAIAGGVRPRPHAQEALGHQSHGMPETAQSVGALGHNKTKLKQLEQL